MGAHRPRHLIFTLFQSNIYKVNVESSSPEIKRTKECPGECAHCRSLCQKNIIYIH